MYKTLNEVPSPSRHDRVFGRLCPSTHSLESLGPRQALNPILFSQDWLHQLFSASLPPPFSSHTLNSTFPSQPPSHLGGSGHLSGPFCFQGPSCCIKNHMAPQAPLQGFGIGQASPPPKSTISYISHSALSKSPPFTLNPKTSLQVHLLSAHHLLPNFKRIKLNRHEGS